MYVCHNLAKPSCNLPEKLIWSIYIYVHTESAHPFSSAYVTMSLYNIVLLAHVCCLMCLQASPVTLSLLPFSLPCLQNLLMEESQASAARREETLRMYHTCKDALTIVSDVLSKTAHTPLPPPLSYDPPPSQAGTSTATPSRPRPAPPPAGTRPAPPPPSSRPAAPPRPTRERPKPPHSTNGAPVVPRYLPHCT